MAEIPLALSKKQQEFLIKFMDRAWEEFPYDDVRARFTAIDLAYSREEKIQTNDERLQATKLRPTIVPVIQPQVDTLTSQLVDIFLRGQPIFSVSSNPENAEAVAQINAAMKKHSEMSGYTAQFIYWLKHVSRYNLNCMEVDWDTKSEISYSNGMSQEADITESAIPYNKLKAIIPYNAFFDTSVRPAEVHENGEYAGYHEVMNRFQLKRLLGKLDSKLTRNATAAFESSPQSWDYVYSPDLIPVDDKFKQSVTEGSIDWYSFFGVMETKNAIKYRGRYILTTMYCRLMPSDLGIQTSRPNTPRIYKVLIVNGCHVIYFEEQTSAHGYLPLVFGQLFDDGLGMQNKSFVENLEPVQKLVTQLHTARVADLARALADRGLFDPLLVDPKTINSPNPSAKMPIKPWGWGKGLLQAAFLPIPYRNDSAGNLIQEASIVTKYGEDIGGLNPIQRGTFVKGNKTLGEFQEVMGNADARTLVIFMVLHSTTIVPIQQMVESNILQYMPPAEIFDPTTKKMVKFDPTMVRQASYAFDTADGLNPQSIFRNPEVLSAALQFIASSPQLQQRYNMVGLFAHIFNVRGATDLKSFELTPEQIKQNLAMQFQNGVVNSASQVPVA